MRTFATLTLIVPILISSAGAALAHAHLRSAVPPVNGTVTQTPREVTIAFTEAIEPRFSTIEVTDANDQRVDDGKPFLAGGDATRLSVALRSLSPGKYTVAWHATSVDTHKSAGTYRFTIAADDLPGIGLEHVWARATAGLTTTGAVYFIITGGARPGVLLGASTPAAEKAELHETINDNGVIKMRPVPRIALTPGQPVEFKPGGYHVMLIGLKSSLKAGDGFPLTLTFERAPPITVTVTVEATGGAAMDHGTMPGTAGK